MNFIVFCGFFLRKICFVYVYDIYINMNYYFNVDFVENIVVSISKNWFIGFNIFGKNIMYLEIYSLKLNVFIVIYWSILN